MIEVRVIIGLVVGWSKIDFIRFVISYFGCYEEVDRFWGRVGILLCCGESNGWIIGVFYSFWMMGRKG